VRFSRGVGHGCRARGPRISLGMRELFFTECFGNGRLVFVCCSLFVGLKTVFAKRRESR